MTPFRIAMLLLCVAGVVLPFRQFIPWLAANDWDIAAMIAAWQANGATSGLFWDMAVTAAALTLWIVWDCTARRAWAGLVAVPAIYLVGVSLGLPLYLLIRGR